MVAAGWAELDPPAEALYDLWLDPGEGTNRIDDPALADVARRPAKHGCTTGWSGPTTRCSTVRSAPAAGTFYNTVDQLSASDPTTASTPDGLTLIPPGP